MRLEERVAALSDTARHSILRNAGVSSVQTVAASALDVWGFAHVHPTAPAEASSTSQAGPTSSYHEQLHESRTFNSPDCVEAMATAWGVQGALSHLQGSAVFPRLEVQRQEHVSTLRATLKSDIRRAWAKEAVRGGVAQARKQDYEAAHAAYRKALELDRRCVDAWVAQGAAFANQGALSQALSSINEALELDPLDVNAVKYRTAIRQRMQQGSQPAQPQQQQQQQQQQQPGTALLPSPPAPTRQPANARFESEPPAASLPSLPSDHTQPPAKASVPSTAASSSSTHSSSSGISSSDSGSGPDASGTAQRPRAGMDVQTAMQILNQHRKSTFFVKTKKRRRSSHKRSRRESSKQRRSSSCHKSGSKRRRSAD